MQDITLVPEVAVAEQSANRSRLIQLSPAEYWQLRAAIRDVEALELQLIVAREDIGRRIREAAERREKLFAEIARKYDLAAAAKYQCNDATCSLHEE